MEENNEKQEGEEESKDDKGDGAESEIAKETRLANEAAQKLEDATAENEKSMAKARLSGGTEAGKAPEKPKRLTDTEYSEAYTRGEVDPFKADGYV